MDFFVFALVDENVLGGLWDIQCQHWTPVVFGVGEDMVGGGIFSIIFYTRADPGRG